MLEGSHQKENKSKKRKSGEVMQEESEAGDNTPKKLSRGEIVEKCCSKIENSASSSNGRGVVMC